jgi:SAM-dependent methyltransferase
MSTEGRCGRATTAGGRESLSRELWRLLPAQLRCSRAVGALRLVLGDARRRYLGSRRRLGPFERLSPERQIALAYDVILGREPDPTGRATYLERLRRGQISPRQLLELLAHSSEAHHGVVSFELGPSLHRSRCDFVQSLPRARHILDLGGTALGRAEGAFLHLGYPYHFDELVVVDLESEDRDALYQEKGTRRSVVETAFGPVRYAYHSMADLGSYDEQSFDLVYCGQSIEHVPRDLAPVVLAGAYRVLRPGGYLALDTPNARVTRLQQEEFIDPDHDYEYTAPEMSELLGDAGFVVLEAKGLNYAGESLRRGSFSVAEVATSSGIFAAIEECYLLTYLCRRTA